MSLNKNIRDKESSIELTKINTMYKNLGSNRHSNAIVRKGKTYISDLWEIKLTVINYLEEVHFEEKKWSKDFQNNLFLNIVTILFIAIINRGFYQ